MSARPWASRTRTSTATASTGVCRPRRHVVLIAVLSSISVRWMGYGPRVPVHQRVVLDFSRRGKPTDNAAIESFNGRFRDECLNVHWFESLDDAGAKIEAWRQDYNEHHPHRALKGLSPNEYARRSVSTAAESLA